MKRLFLICLLLIISIFISSDTSFAIPSKKIDEIEFDKNNLPDLSKSDKQANIFYDTAINKMKLKDYKGAIENFDKAIELNPKNVSFYNNRGIAKQLLLDFQGAIKDYNKAIELNPVNDNIYYNRGLAKQRLEDFQGAIKDYTKAIELNPNNKSAIYNRNFAQKNIGSIKENNDSVKFPEYKSLNKIEDIDFGPYMADLQKRIKSNWKPPRDNNSKQIIVLFTIARNGELLNYKIIQSSGIPDADKAAREAIEKSKPFEPLPTQYTQPFVDIQFTFDYNVFDFPSK